MIRDETRACDHCSPPGSGRCAWCEKNGEPCKDGRDCEGDGKCFSCDGTGKHSYFEPCDVFIGGWEGKLEVRQVDGGNVVFLDGQRLGDLLKDENILCFDDCYIGIDSSDEDDEED